MTTLQRCPLMAEVNATVADGSTKRLCDACVRDHADDIVETTPILAGYKERRPRCEGEG